MGASAMLRNPVGRLMVAAVFPFVVVGCDGPLETEAPDPGATLTVDASSRESWALVDLGTPAQLVEAADPATSTAWDIGFRVTSVTVNGGESGPAGVMAYCLCQNGGATSEEIMAMTPASESAEFDEVTAADIPAEGAIWSATAFDENRWYRYNLGGNHQVWPTYDVYLVKRGTEVYKVQLTGYYGPDGAARQITMRYARLRG